MLIHLIFSTRKASNLSVTFCCIWWHTSLLSFSFSYFERNNGWSFTVKARRIKTRQIISLLSWYQGCRSKIELIGINLHFTGKNACYLSLSELFTRLLANCHNHMFRWRIQKTVHRPRHLGLVDTQPQFISPLYSCNLPDYFPIYLCTRVSNHEHKCYLRAMAKTSYMTFASFSHFEKSGPIFTQSNELKLLNFCMLYAKS